MNVTVTFITSEDGILQVIFLVQTGYIRGQVFFFIFFLIHFESLRGRKAGDMRAGNCHSRFYYIYLTGGMFLAS